MKIKKWLTATPDLQKARSLSTACGFSPLAAAVLCARGVDTKEKAETFLATDLEHLYDPMLLKDMDLAVKALKDSIEKNEKIIVFGDYDVDGITSTCVLLRYLKSKGANADYYIPNRLSEGYGLSCSSHDPEEAWKILGTKRGMAPDCFGATAWLYYVYNFKIGIPARDICYASATASSGTHHTIQIKKNGKWIDPPQYSQVTSLLGVIKSRPSQHICREPPSGGSIPEWSACPYLR